MLRKLDKLKLILIRNGFEPDKVERFIQWDHDNNWAWDAIVLRFNELYRDGLRSIGMKGIFEDLRKDIRYCKRSNFKLDNTWTSFYGHSMLIVFPKIKGILRVQEIKKNSRFYLNKVA